MIEKPTFWDTQIMLLLFAVTSVVWGGIVYLIQMLVGGPTWLPYIVGLVVFVVLSAFLAFLQKFGHR